MCELNPYLHIWDSLDKVAKPMSEDKICENQLKIEST